MKRLLTISALLAATAMPAIAADIPVKARPMVPVVAVWNWTGFYIGLNGGYSWGRSRTNVSYFTAPGGAAIVPPAGSITSADFNLNGGVFGGQIGYNWQVSSSWVFGLEADAQWTGQKGSGTFTCAATAIGGPCLPGLTFLPPGVTGSAFSISQELEWFGTVRARAGVLVTPEVLLYVTGGLAYGSIQTSTAFTVPTGIATSVTALTSGSTLKTGWTIGGGVEAMFARDWTFKLEYLYVDLGTVSGTTTAITIPPTFGITAAWDSRITDNIIRAGINYHFSPGPVVARY